jgi:hypothetical protein
LRFVVLVIYVPLWFRAIKGVSAVKSGIMTFPTTLSRHRHHPLRRYDGKIRVYHRGPGTHRRRLDLRERAQVCLHYPAPCG